MRLSLALPCLLASEVAFAFQAVQRSPSSRIRATERIATQGMSASFSTDPDSARSWSLDGNDASSMEAAKPDVDLDQQEIERRQQQVQQRQNAGRFRLNVPLVSEADSNISGLSLVQVGSGCQVLNRELSLENLQIHKRVQPLQDDACEHFNPNELPVNFSGVVVATVDPAGKAWARGVRPGDVLRSVSATLGNSLWPKSTLEGVQSALYSRKVVSSWAVLEFERLSVEAEAQTFELTLTKPCGFQIQETADGYVTVSSIQDTASSLVSYGLQVGDRVLAVDSTLGDKLWPVSTVEGVISACTSRLPGQSITFRFERTSDSIAAGHKEQTSTSVSVTAEPAAANQKESLTVAPQVSIAPSQAELVSRCREVLRKYSLEKSTKLDGVVPALVADKVVDALASASVALDSVTLSMIMRAYTSCKQPNQAIRVFEAATGFNANGSLTPVTSMIENEDGSHLLPSESALNLYTGSVLMQAHALRGDIGAVCRVLAALEGRSGTVVDGLEVAPWPWTGTFGAIQPDTKCYNIALAAAERIGGEEALQFAQELFEHRMSPPNSEIVNGKPGKDVVTYNTMMSILSNQGLTDGVFRLFDELKRSGIRPDRYTYSSLAKSCADRGDLQEVLYDMTELGIKPDVIIYNTIVKSLCAERKWTEATKLINEMESKGISPDSMTYGLLMNAMMQADKPDSCLMLFESACVNEKTAGLTQNVYLYTTAITAASVIGDHERALDLVSRMTANGVKPNLKTMTAVVGACLSAGKHELAVQVFERIEQPDGYAISQGLRAYCGVGDLETAATMLYNAKRGKERMTGKQIMSSYQHVLQTSLRGQEFDLARRVFTDLLKKGFIPSSAILSVIVGAFEIDSRSIVEATQADKNRFQFLLFVLDSMRQRKLPIDGSFYVSTLLLGRQIGGVQRRVANYLVQARTGISKNPDLLSTKEGGKGILLHYSWEDFVPLDETTIKSVELPDLTVRVNPRDTRRVIRTEQSVLYSSKPRKARGVRPHRTAKK